jgi:hypothetical protein
VRKEGKGSRQRRRAGKEAGMQTKTKIIFCRIENVKSVEACYAIFF